MGDLLQTSLSGLLASQQSLATTSHNIANVNTPGYSRQQALLDTYPATYAGNGFIGNGVQVSTIRRDYSASLTSALRSNNASYTGLDTLATLSGQVDNLLGDSTAGLTPTLQSFFNDVQQLANDPSSSVSQQVLLSQANTLTNRLQFLSGNLQQMDSQSKTSLSDSVDQVNSLANQIAQLNQQIVIAQQQADGQPPNDLLDKRDQLLQQLSGQVNVSVVQQSDGAENVFVGTGQALVSGNQSNTLKVTTSQYDKNSPAIVMVNGSGSNDITQTLTGGAIGGALDFRREVLQPAEDNLGRIATTLAVSFNNQHHLGMSFYGGTAQLGGDFFSVGQPQVFANQSNTATGQPAVSIDTGNVGALTGSNYKLSYDGSNWTLTRLSDNTATMLTSNPTSIDGMTIDTSAISGAVAGDSYLIRPTRLGASEIGVKITQPGEIASASPLVGGDQTNSQGVSTNTGSAQIGNITVTSTSNLPLGGTIQLKFDATNNQFDVTGPGGLNGTIPYNPATSGSVTFDGTNFTPIGGSPSLDSYGGLRFTITGKPADGDTFVINSNSSGTGDGANMRALANLATKPVLDNGATSIQDASSGLVGQIGSTTQQANTNRDAQKTLLDQSQSARDSLSGVNLDEEAANMIKFQQAYQAAARMITTSQALFNSLLTATQ